MIIFKTVRWRNMLSTGNDFSEVRLDQHQTTLIVGNNGHGKSTLLDAICFGLFGKPFRSINKPMLVNSINEKNMVVELEFKIGAKEYKIRRGVNPNFFEIYIGNDLVNQDAISNDYQKYLETTILKFNMKSFKQIVVLGSKSFVPFMKLPSYERRIIIENLLDISIFSLMNKVAKEDLLKAKQAVADNKSGIEATTGQIELQKKYVEDSKKNNQEAIERMLEDIGQNALHLKKLEQDEADMTDAATALLQTVTDRDKVEATLTQLNKLETKIEGNRSKAKRDYTFYHDNNTCPTCKQGLDHDFKTNAIGTANAAIARYETGLAQMESQKNILNERLTEIQSVMKAYHKAQTEINKNRVSQKHILEYIEKIKQDIAAMQTKTVLSEDMMAVSEDLIKKLMSQNLMHRKLVEDRAYHEVAVSLLKDGGIKAQIIKQYLPVMNQMVNKYLSAMDFYVNFELDEEFNESIKSRHRDAFSYDSFSEGEKQKIDIALLFAWRAVAKMKNSMNTNLLILDEIFDSSLDGAGADLVLEILASMPHESNVFVISHRELLHDKFNNTIRFQKRNNFSEIVSEV